MLLNLSIRNVVLIDRLDLSVEAGLSVLTGETGAGKSILLDALGLALGARADVGLVRAGQGQASVAAHFEPPINDPVFDLLKAQDIEADEGQIILRRVLRADGRSRAFVNDQPVSIGLLKDLGEAMVEVHGQQDDRGLLNPAGHRNLLDAFGDHDALLTRTGDRYHEMVAARKALAAKLNAIETARVDEEYYRHALAELEKMSPLPGEEAQLSEHRALMMQGEKAVGLLDDVLKQLKFKGGVDAKLRGAIRQLDRAPDELKSRLDPIVEAFDRAVVELDSSLGLLETLRRDMEFDQNQQDETEERLFALRSLARKHKCQVDDLPAMMIEITTKMQALDAGEEALVALKADVKAKTTSFEAAVVALTKAREKAAKGLDKKVAVELPPLKLEKAKFQTCLQALGPDDWSGMGGERVEFMVSTNPGAPFTPLLKTASGGETSRIVLALKVSLMEKGSAPSLVFDEVDKGIGGATADAVGERLKRLAEGAQVLVITHSPQVAARGATHWHISKSDKKTKSSDLTTITRVVELDEGERREEIARMLSGAKVTDEARAQADKLLGVG